MKVSKFWPNSAYGLFHMDSVDIHSVEIRSHTPLSYYLSCRRYLNTMTGLVNYAKTNKTKFCPNSTYSLYYTDGVVKIWPYWTYGLLRHGPRSQNLV